ncbi:hypothetical protein BVC80_9013g47 [Macleaya cordata]|uniref:Uncharacterized protein n=1 Tax=Macleaya cordata TaxID=56857 RepID=A0A200QQ47_MACCD|nr:hypothetical protein BVC80_9013g47 [Macleaya cordata]
MMQHTTLQVRNGTSIYLWIDRWTGQGTLKESYPQLYKLSRTKKATIAEAITNQQEWNFNFRRELNLDEVEDLNHLLDDVGEPPTLDNRDDSRCCSLARGSFFNPKDCYVALISDDNFRMNENYI